MTCGFGRKIEENSFWLGQVASDEGLERFFLKVWLRATRRQTQIPFGNDKDKDSASKEQAVRAIPSEKLLYKAALGTGKPVPLSKADFF